MKKAESGRLKDKTFFTGQVPLSAQPRKKYALLGFLSISLTLFFGTVVLFLSTWNVVYLVAAIICMFGSLMTCEEWLRCIIKEELLLHHIK
ncbi:MAG TPA: hypothetical protein VFM02_04065 [Candidatus Paceibacterota bacterium]|nr:hypothetical protein [Candidatus Paceibacterota bacterium]